MDDDAFSSEIDSIMAEDSGGETREYAKGGDVRKYAPGGYVGGEENAQLYRDAPIKGFEMVPMTNDAGQTIYIPFINGVAQLSIPSGYKVKTAGAVETPVAEKPTEAAPTTGGDGGGDDGGGGGDSDDTGGGGSTSNAPGVQGSFSPVTGQQVGIASMALGMMGLPGMTIANLGKNSIAEAINTIGYNSAVSNNMSVVGEMMGLDPNDPANTAAISAAIDSTPNMGEQTSAPTATVGSTGTGGGAAAAAAAAASAAAAAGMSAAAQGAASQAAASATVGGASAGEAATAGANAAAAADQGDVAEGGAMAAEANNAVGDASDPDGTVGGGGGGGGAGGCFLTTAAVEHMGHNDDGQLLNTLRDFRDTYMRKNKEASKDVAWYYENAPKIVKALDEHPDAKKIYRKMYNRFIMPSYLAIKMGKDEVAYGLYKRGINFARQEAGIKNEDIEPRYGKHGTTDADVKKHTGLGAKSKK
jgi:hypothetical protein